MYRIDIWPEAMDDIHEAARWYEEQCAGLGRDFMSAAFSAIESLSERAEHHAVMYRAGHIEVRWGMPRRFPHRIFYYLDGAAVRVFAVLHSKRGDESWVERL